MSYWPATIVPRLSTELALPTALDSAAGSVGMASDSGHTHATKVQRTIVTLNSSGEATWTFARSIAGMPAIACLPIEAGATQPIVFKVVSFANSGSTYTGVTIRGMRARVLPSSILSLTALLLYDIFAGTAPNGVSVCLFAAEVTQ